MSARIVTASERPELNERGHKLTAVVWPEYNQHGDVLREYWSRLDVAYAEFQFVLYDETTDEVIAQGHSIPCAWDGTVEGLPAGVDGLIRDAFHRHEAGEPADTLSALAIEIMPAHQGGGLSRVMVDAMRSLAREHGFRALIAPLRPSWKDRYPLTPIERYARWTRDDGLPFDPWIRTHVRLGAEVVRPEPQSLRISGTVDEWEEWTDMRFPDSGPYVFPHGLAPVEIDREADRGIYFEPNVWVRHAVA